MGWDGSVTVCGGSLDWGLEFLPWGRSLGWDLGSLPQGGSLAGIPPALTLLTPQPAPLLLHYSIKDKRR